MTPFSVAKSRSVISSFFTFYSSFPATLCCLLLYFPVGPASPPASKPHFPVSFVQPDTHRPHFYRRVSALPLLRIASPSSRPPWTLQRAQIFSRFASAPAIRGLQRSGIRDDFRPGWRWLSGSRDCDRGESLARRPRLPISLTQYSHRLSTVVRRLPRPASSVSPP